MVRRITEDNRAGHNDALNTKRAQKWINEALASGTVGPLTEKEMDAIRDSVLKGKRP
jgi:hypothetical protein